MGVQRKAAQVNWIASFGLIILAGTLYRLRKFNNAIFKTQMTDIMEKMGQRLNWRTQRSIIRSKKPLIKGQWEQIKSASNHYKLCNKVYKFLCSSERLFNSGKKVKRN